MNALDRFLIEKHVVETRPDGEIILNQECLVIAEKVFSTVKEMFKDIQLKETEAWRFDTKLVTGISHELKLGITDNVKVLPKGGISVAKNKDSYLIPGKILEAAFKHVRTS